MNLKDLLSFDEGLVLECPGTWDGDVEGLCPVHSLRPGHMTFVKDQKFFERFLESKKHASASGVGLVVDRKFWQKLVSTRPTDEEQIKSSFAYILTSENVDVSISKLSWPFYLQRQEQTNDHVDGRQMGTAQVHSTAKIAQNVFLGKDVVIGAHVEILPGCVVMSGTQINEGSKLYPNVTLYENVSIGRNCRIHSGTVIGADGFGYNFHDGNHLKVWHLGSVIIEDNVEIGSQSNIDAGAMAPTVIGEGTKIDSLVQIGHNCLIGKKVIICGQVGVAGSAVIEDYCVLGGKAGIGPGVTLQKGCQIAGAAEVNTSWPAGSVLGGHPARPLKEWLRGLAYVRKMSLGKGN